MVEPKQRQSLVPLSQVPGVFVDRSIALPVFEPLFRFCFFWVRWLFSGANARAVEKSTGNGEPGLIQALAARR